MGMTQKHHRAMETLHTIRRLRGNKKRNRRSLVESAQRARLGSDGLTKSLSDFHLTIDRNYCDPVLLSAKSRNRESLTAALAFLFGQFTTFADCAEALGVHERTILRWLADGVPMSWALALNHLVTIKQRGGDPLIYLREFKIEDDVRRNRREVEGFYVGLAGEG